MLVEDLGLVLRGVGLGLAVLRVAIVEEFLVTLLGILGISQSE